MQRDGLRDDQWERIKDLLPGRPRAASLCRIELSFHGWLRLVRRVFKSSRQAMTCARVTVRNSSGRSMPVKRMKSRTASPRRLASCADW
jgi:hypothetical protein